MTVWVGIDFGTSNSSIAYYNGRNAEIIEMPDGKRSIPSVVTIVGEDVFVGLEAIEKGREHRQQMFKHFKRRMGERFDDEAAEAGNQTCADPETGLVAWRLDGDRFVETTDLASYVIDELLKAATAKLGERPTKAVLTIPADSGEAQKAATLEAGRKAGLDRIELRHEPTMAALVAGYTNVKRRVIVVPDHGGGTFDVTLLETGKGRNDHALVSVLATDGRRKGLGGIDFDREAVRYLVNRLQTSHPDSDISSDNYALERVTEQAEEAKKTLSRKSEARVFVPNIGRSSEGTSIPLDETLDLKTFAVLSERLTDQIAAICRRVVEKAKEKDPKFQLSDIHEVVAVGGMMRSKIVRDAIESVFGKKVRKDINPEEAVALGAAVEAAIVSGRLKGVTVRDITSQPIAVETVDDVASLVFPAGTPYPAERTVIIANADEGQGALSIAVLEGDNARASGCEVIASHDHIVEQPGKAKANKLKLVFRLDEGGRLSVDGDDGWKWKGAA